MAFIIRIILLVLFLSSHSFGAYYPIPLPGANGNVLTSNGSKWTSASASASNPTQSYEISNLGLATSVAASALTIALKQADGSTDPNTGTAAVKVGMRSSTLTSGLYNQRSATAATSLVISSGSTLGQTSAQPANIYIYLLDNAGTLELAASGSLYPEVGVISTTAEGGAGAADSNTVVYSTTARTSVPFRLVGVLTNTQTTAGTWASAGTVLGVGEYGTLKTNNVPTIQKFTSGSGTYITPAGVSYIRVRMIGGGGGGGGGGSAAGGGGTGGTTSFGTSLISASGGNGGTAGSGGGAGAPGGTASLGTGPIGTATTGGAGSAGASGAGNIGGTGGNGIFGGGGGSGQGAAGTVGAANTGGGGGGGGMSGALGGGGGGGGGGGVVAIINNPLTSYAYSVGAAGTAGSAGGSGFAGGAGAAGYIEVTEYYY